MIANILYTLTSFSDYSQLSYNKEDVIAVLSNIEEFELAPVIVQELNDNGPSQRMHFVANNGGLIITIGSERIDITINSNRKEGFGTEEKAKAKDALLYCMTKLHDVFENRVAIPYRLAWNTAYIYFEIDEEGIKKYKNRFRESNSFFDDNPLEDMVVRYGAWREPVLCKKAERINVLTTIGRYIATVSDQEVDGFRIEHDINTWQMNRMNRFTIEDIQKFIEDANKIQDEVNERVLP